MICIKTLIEEYYNIKIIKLEKYNDYYIIHSSREIYYLYMVKSIGKVKNQLYATFFIGYFYIPVLNKYNNVFFDYNNQLYILFKYSGNNFNMDYLINETLLLNSNYILNWKGNWKQKSDYIYNFFIINKVDNDYIINSIDYYLGMAEYAISLLDNYDIYYGRCSLCYIRYDNMDFCNPLNIKIDLFERNLAEYLRLLFYDTNYNIESIDSILYRHSSYCDFNLVLARMIYPSNYFYSLEEFFVNNNINLLCGVISKCDLYEVYIMDIYNMMSKYQNIKKISFT